MASVRARKDTGHLFLDFRYGGKRYREQTLLADTTANRKRLEKLAQQLEKKIATGTFEYGSFFPESTNSPAVKAGPQASGLPVAAAASPGPNRTPSLESFYRIWSDEMAPTWRQTYRESIQTTFETHVLPFFGRNREVGDIKKEDIHAFRAHLAKGSPVSKRKLSPSTINRVLKILRMMFDEATDRYQFSSPFAGVKLLKEPKPDIKPLTLDEVQKILANVRADLRNYFTVRCFTGLRSGEANGLKWQHIDFELNQILVRETYVNGRTEYTKNDGSQREVVMSRRVRTALLDQYAVSGHLEYVFTNRLGQPLDNRNLVNRVWAPLLRYLGIPYRRPYVMRHTAATLWLAAGESPEWIARQLGHTSTEMLFKRYSRFVPNATRQDGSAFERLIEQQFGGDK